MTTAEFDDCPESPDGKHSDSWYAYHDCEHCKQGKEEQMSNTDKRSVSTDALETLGTVIGPDEKRDAIHLAVEPVTAGQNLDRGEYIRIVNGVAYRAHPENAHGIVDPFLQFEGRDWLAIGERFWFVMKPRMVHSLRHVWSHPDFPDEGESAVVTEWTPMVSKEDAEKWLRDYIARTDMPDFDTVMTLLEDGEVSDGEYRSYYETEYLNFGGYECHGDIAPEFWDYASAYLGKKLVMRPTHFSCHC